MTKPVVMASTLVTDDHVPIEAIHLPGNSDLAIVVAHGFTLSWQRPNVWRIANRLNRMAGVLTFDFRGHGRSGGSRQRGRDRERRGRGRCPGNGDGGAPDARFSPHDDLRDGALRQR